jgi:hypothetical protein
MRHFEQAAVEDEYKSMLFKDHIEIRLLIEVNKVMKAPQSDAS